MRINLFSIAILGLLFFVSCSENIQETSKPNTESIATSLPFTNIGLNDIDEFKNAMGHWKIRGDVYSDSNQEKMLVSEEGSGILVYTPNDKNKNHLYTTFEHGDLELELDVMISKGSNSGLYFQSRYEVQLFDSWRVDKQKDGDVMGGIPKSNHASNEEDNTDLEGFVPKVNIAKAPGLWQHIKVIFHAPKFDALGNKTKNAWFEEVWLNGILIQKDVELSAPAKSEATLNEVPLAPLMFEGNSGAVAFKNIRYKKYNDNTIWFKNLQLQEYGNTTILFPNLDSLVPMKDTAVETIDLKTIANNNSQKLFKYTGAMVIPDSGDYLFHMSVEGGGALLINNDTLINMNGSYNRDSLGIKKIRLNQGEVPFTILYNKHNPWWRHFNLFAEGPEIQKYSLQKVIAQQDNAPTRPDYTIKVTREPITQRSFWMHGGKKRTHCISVGMPEQIHYTYDLEMGSLLTLWGGDFIDAEKMWHDRGEKQLGEPLGAVISLHGSPDFAPLHNVNDSWPILASDNLGFRSMGYEFDDTGLPQFICWMNDSEIVTSIIPSNEKRGLKRTINISGSNRLWHKVAQGESIKKLPDGRYIVNDESFFVRFSNRGSLTPIIRQSGEAYELLVEIPEGKQKVEYEFIW